MDNGLAPKVLVCEECGEEFILTVAAQKYFKTKGYLGDPKLCKSCHIEKKKKEREGTRHSANI